MSEVSSASPSAIRGRRPSTCLLLLLLIALSASLLAPARAQTLDNPIALNYSMPFITSGDFSNDQYQYFVFPLRSDLGTSGAYQFTITSAISITPELSVSYSGFTTFDYSVTDSVRSTGQVANIYVPVSQIPAQNTQLYVRVRCVTTIEDKCAYSVVGFRYVSSTMPPAGANRHAIWMSVPQNQVIRRGAPVYFEHRAVYPPQYSGSPSPLAEIWLSAFVMVGRINIYVLPVDFSQPISDQQLPRAGSSLWNATDYTGQVLALPSGASPTGGYLIGVESIGGDAHVQLLTGTASSQGVPAQCKIVTNAISVASRAYEGTSQDFCFHHLATRCPFSVDITSITGDTSMDLYGPSGNRIAYSNVDGSDNIYVPESQAAVGVYRLVVNGQRSSSFTVLYSTRCNEYAASSARSFLQSPGARHLSSVEEGSKVESSLSPSSPAPSTCLERRAQRDALRQERADAAARVATVRQRVDTLRRYAESLHLTDGDDKISFGDASPLTSSVELSPEQLNYVNGLMRAENRTFYHQAAMQELAREEQLAVDAERELEQLEQTRFGPAFGSSISGIEIEELCVEELGESPDHTAAAPGPSMSAAIAPDAHDLSTPFAAPSSHAAAAITGSRDGAIGRRATPRHPSSAAHSAFWPHHTHHSGRVVRSSPASHGSARTLHNVMSAENTDADADADAAAPQHSFEPLAILVNRTLYSAQLRPGVPQYSELQSDGDFMRFVYRPRALDQDVTFSLIQEFGADPNLYVSSTVGPLTTLPSATSYMWRSAYVGDDFITVDKEDETGCRVSACVYLIYVQIKGRKTGFTLTASEGEAQTMLRAGVAVTRMLPAGQYDYYQFAVEDPGVTLRFTLLESGNGRPVMYVTSGIPYPSNETYRWYRAVTGADSSTSATQLTILPDMAGACTPNRWWVCTYYVAVYAGEGRQSAFTLVASLNGSVILRPNAYQVGDVVDQAINYYRINVRSGYGAAHLTWSTEAGSIGVYISTRTGVNPVPSQPSTYQLSSTSAAGRLSSSESSSTTACVYATDDPQCTITVAVVGRVNGTSTFALLVSLGTTQYSTPLRTAIPTPSSSQANVTRWFWYRFTDFEYNLQICVTRLSGTGPFHLYLSWNTSIVFPTAYERSADWTSGRLGYLCGYALQSTNFDLYLGVEPSEAMSYTIMIATFDGLNDTDSRSQIQLTDGQPQASYHHLAQLTLYYSLRLATSAAALTVSVFNLYGDVDIYGNFGASSVAIPSAGNSQWSSARVGNDVLQISNAAAGRYLFAVVSRLQYSWYFITASTPAAVTQLQDGVWQASFAPAGTYKQFAFRMATIPTSNRVSVNIALLFVSGNSDLFVSTQPSPNSTNAIWRSSLGSSDYIAIGSADANRCRVVGCTYYVSVYGAEDSEFRIKVSLNEATPLTNGASLQGNAEPEAFVYYTFSPASLDDAVQVYVTTMSGSPYLLVSRTTQTPTFNDYTWSDMPQFGSVLRVRIEPTDSNSCRSRNVTLESCVYYIGVVAAADHSTNTPRPIPATWRLVASTVGSSTLLLAGRALDGSAMAGAYSYFYYVHDVTNADLTISVTGLSGDPDLYVSRTNPRPNATSYDFRSMSGAFEIVNVKNAAVGIWYIGVRAASAMNSTFRVLATTYNPLRPWDSTTWLDEMASITDAVGLREWRYYLMITDYEQTTMTISLASLTGNPDLYVIGPAFHDINPNVFPNLTYYQWRSANTGSDSLSITNSQKGRYLVGAYGASSSVYRISVSYSGGVTPLYSWQRESTLTAGQIQYFKYNLQTLIPNSTLSFGLAPVTGNPDLYVSDTAIFPNPGVRSTYNWSSTLSQLDIVSIPPSAGLRVGDYRITVLARTNTTFYISATYGQLPFFLTEGSSQQVSMAPGQASVFRMTLPGGTSRSDWALSLSPYWGQMQVYVALDAAPQPNGVGAQWSFTSTLPSPQSLRLPASSCPASYTTCDFYATVTASSWSNFLISYARTSTPTLLTAGTVVSGSVTVGGYTLYSFRVTTSPVNVTVTMTVLSGNPDMYVSRNSTVQVSSYEWKSANPSGGEIVRIRPDDPLFAGRSMVGTYYIAVYGVTAATFTIAVQVLDPTAPVVRPLALVAGSSQLATTAAQQYSYFSIALTRDMWPYSVEISVSPQTGDPNIYVRADTDLSTQTNIPSNRSSQWSSATDGDERVTILPSSTNACNPTAAANCVYTIAVQAAGSVAARYTILARLGDTLIDLASGQPVQVLTQAAGSMRSYRMINNFWPAATPASSFAVSALTGDPNLYVSQRSVPSPTDYEYRSELNSSLIDYVGMQLNRSVWYVTVHTPVASSYVLLGLNYLWSRPQDSVVPLTTQFAVPTRHAKGNWRYYSFTMTQAMAGADYMRVAVTADFGNPDVFVTRDTPWPTTAPNVTCAPGAASCWYSNRTGSDIVRIASPQPGTYRIAVLATETSVYLISVGMSGQATRLSQGVPEAAEVQPGSYAYFSFRVDSLAQNRNTPIVFSIKPSLAAGSAGVYVSKDAARPSVNAYTWKSAAGEDNFVVINPSDVTTGVYYVGVYGAASDRVSFTIVATYASRVVLASGVDQPMLVLANTTQQFSLEADAKASGRLSLLVKSDAAGAVRVYASSRAAPNPAAPTSEVVSSLQTQSPDHVLMVPQGLCASNVCTYYVAVAANRRASVTLVPTIGTGDSGSTGNNNNNDDGSSSDASSSSAIVAVAVIIPLLVVVIGGFLMYRSYRARRSGGGGVFKTSDEYGDTIEMNDVPKRSKGGSNAFARFGSSNADRLLDQSDREGRGARGEESNSYRPPTRF